MKNLLLQTVLIISLSSSSFASMGSNDPLRSTLMVESLEYQFNDEETIAWDAYAYFGYDLNKVYIYSEGERTQEEIESENQLVYSRAISPYWDVQMGVAYDKTDESDQVWGVIGLSGLAPYFFETRGVILISEDANIGVRLATEYEALLTQKLIFSPSMELSAYTKDNLEMGLGKGLSNLTLGANLRYEFIREFAPYVGIEWSKNFAKTQELTPLNETYATIGIRFWF